jgi:kinesin family protein 3/17
MYWTAYKFYILEDSLGGNCKTTMIAMISPALEAFSESASTLMFANRAKSIQNQARVNEESGQRTLLKKYEKELKRLRIELERRSQNVVDKRKLLELEEQKRQAEEDKLAAIKALEVRSKELLKVLYRILYCDLQYNLVTMDICNGFLWPMYNFF